MGYQRSSESSPRRPVARYSAIAHQEAVSAPQSTAGLLRVRDSQSCVDRRLLARWHTCSRPGAAYLSEVRSEMGFRIWLLSELLPSQFTNLFIQPGVKAFQGDLLGNHVEKVRGHKLVFGQDALH